MKKVRTEGNDEKAAGILAVQQGAQRIHIEAVLEQAREGLLSVAMQAGLGVLSAMLERDRDRIVGPKSKPSTERHAYRYGNDEAPVVLGGRKVLVSKPRVRSVEGDREIVLPSWEWATREDPLDERAMQQMLVGVSTRDYAKNLEPAPSGIGKSLCVSRSSVSRRFVAQTRARVDSFLTRPLGELDLVVVMIDGTWLGDHLQLVALGIDAAGHKHVLGVREGSTENEAVCRSLLSELVDRGLAVERTRLFVIDGGKGIRKAIRGVFGEWALIQRCRVHKLRNVLEHLPEGQQAWVRATMRRAWASKDPAAAKRRLNALANQLEPNWPSAASSLREGLDETLTIAGLGVTGALYRTLSSTNPIENLQSLFKRVARRVTRWRDGAMALRWAVTGLMEAAKSFRRIRGYRELTQFLAVLDAHRDATPTINKKVA